MKNPWKDIPLDAYESHMSWNSVLQLQAMNLMMKDQLAIYPVDTVMILGIAGGNGLEHIDGSSYMKVYGIDINDTFLKECTERFTNLDGILECLCVDLTDPDASLPHSDLVLANLLVEYIGYDCFKDVIGKTQPTYVSCIIQINATEGFVSDSPYLHVFDELSRVHHQMEDMLLNEAMSDIGYVLSSTHRHPLPNGKELLRLDYSRAI